MWISTIYVDFYWPNVFCLSETQTLLRCTIYDVRARDQLRCFLQKSRGQHGEPDFCAKTQLDAVRILHANVIYGRRVRGHISFSVAVSEDIPRRLLVPWPRVIGLQHGGHSLDDPGWSVSWCDEEDPSYRLHLELDRNCWEFRVRDALPCYATLVRSNDCGFRRGVHLRHVGRVGESDDQGTAHPLLCHPEGK